MYEYKKEVEIFGFDSLEESLIALYGDGGYLYTFEKDAFFHKDGLGNLEVITKDILTPKRVERVDDPVSALRAYGVSFVYKDLRLPENEVFRNYQQV